VLQFPQLLNIEALFGWWRFEICFRFHFSLFLKQIWIRILKSQICWMTEKIVFKGLETSFFFFFFFGVFTSGSLAALIGASLDREGRNASNYSM
jgi:hypothetical protein